MRLNNYAIPLDSYAIPLCDSTGLESSLFSRFDAPIMLTNSNRKYNANIMVTNVFEVTFSLFQESKCKGCPLLRQKWNLHRPHNANENEDIGADC